MDETAKLNQLEDIVKRRAHDRLCDEWYKLCEAMKKHPIMSSLRLTHDNVSFCGNANEKLFSGYDRDFKSKHTNIESVAKRLLVQYEEEEAKTLMKNFELLAQYVDREKRQYVGKHEDSRPEDLPF